jgi:hypothetical protein
METSSVVRYLEAHRKRAFSGITEVPRSSMDIKAEPWLVWLVVGNPAQCHLVFPPRTPALIVGRSPLPTPSSACR